MCSSKLMQELHTFVNTCLQRIRVLTRSYEYLEGAYGVVGFSGVKDARKSVFIADASASADRPASYSELLDKRWTDTGQILDRYWTNTGQLLCKRCAMTVHLLCNHQRLLSPPA